MTSRDVSPRKLEDSLDVMIRWTLHEQAAGSVPSPDLWQRISERVAERTGLNGRAAWWRRLRLSVGDLARGLLNAPLEAPPEYSACYPPVPRYLWETGGLLLLLPHGDLPMRPGPAGAGVVPLLN